jgi:membrane protease YdiL (CAAX protease family)
MNMASRIGHLSSIGLFVVGVVYLAVVAFGIRQAGLEDPIVDPTLAVMEALTLLSAPLIVAVMAAIYETASRDRKVLGAMALAFAAVMAGLTSAVHFVALTAGRQTGFAVLQWPSTLYAVELLAWDIFLGLSLLCAAYVFVGSGIRSIARWSLAVAGALSVLGAAGPIVGDMALQRIGILGYGVGLPIAALVLSQYFRRHEAP